MRKNYRKMFAALLALVLAVSLCACAAKAPSGPSSPEGGSPSSRSEDLSSQPGPELEPKPEEADIAVEDIIDDIMDTYYLVDYPEVDRDGFIPDDLRVGRLAHWHTTNSYDIEAMEALLEKLRNGEKLADELQGENYWKAMVYDSDGNLCGSVDVSTIDHKVVASGLDGDATFRWDFRWPELLETAVAEGKIDPDTARLRACEFVNFAVGAVLYDDSREYFIPTNGEAMHLVPFEVGTLYPVPELADMLYDHLDELPGYPSMNTGAKG